MRRSLLIPVFLSVFLAGLVAAFFGNCIAAPDPASPPAGSSNAYSGIIAHQTTGWGVYDIKACPAGIQIVTRSGATLVAVPPDWTVYLFRKGQKRAAKLTYARFETKNQYAMKLSEIGQRPRIIDFLGMKAIQFNFNINKRLDESMSLGSLYRSKQIQPIVLRKEVLFAPPNDLIPKQAKEIWRSYFEIPVREEIPLQTILFLANGDKRMPMETKTFKRGNMTASDFTVPKGLEYTAQYVEMIYGKEMEGVADLLVDP